MTPDILILEEDPFLARNLSIACQKMGNFAVGAANTRQGKMHSEIHAQNLKLVVMSVQPTDPARQALFLEIRKRLPDVPILQTTSTENLPMAVANRERGAEYLTKPFDLEVFSAMARDLMEFGVRVGPTTSVEALPILIGSSQPMQRVLAALSQASNSENPVLITGEEGTGKTLAARLIHTHGPRAGKPFVSLDCATVAEGEWATVFFSQELKDGVVEGVVPRADGGSLNLENVDLLPLEIQQRLLRLLEQRTYENTQGRIQGPVSLRILSSSSKDLGQELLAGNFRQDLYFRLNTHGVALPPLRQRLDDLPALASSFLSNHGIPGEIELGPDAIERLRQYSWPGNVGELKAVMDHAAQQVGRGMVHSRNLPPLFQAATSDTLAGLSRRLDSALGAWLRERITLAPAEYDYVHSELERMVLRHLLVEYDSKPTALANGLNMNRNTLRKKLQMAGLNQ